MNMRRCPRSANHGADSSAEWKASRRITSRRTELALDRSPPDESDEAREPSAPGSREARSRVRPLKWSSFLERALGQAHGLNRDSFGSSPCAAYTGDVSVENTPAPESKRRIQIGWVVSGLGFVAILWGVFHLTNATVGGPIHEFKDRRTYTEVKKATHEAFPGTLVRALAGLVLVWWGGRIRASAGREGQDG
jgi:hypothetical protein